MASKTNPVDIADTEYILTIRDLIEKALEQAGYKVVNVAQVPRASGGIIGDIDLGPEARSINILISAGAPLTATDMQRLRMAAEQRRHA